MNKKLIATVLSGAVDVGETPGSFGCLGQHAHTKPAGESSFFITIDGQSYIVVVERLLTMVVDQ